MARHNFFKSFDGTKIFYSKEGQGPVLLFCYGLVCSKLHWAYQMEYFKQKGYTVVWFDYRGHHNSEIPKDIGKLTLENIAHDAQYLLEELKIENVTVLGHSMGVNVVLELYRRIPEKIQALVLANGSARAPLETMFRSNISQFVFPVLYNFYKKYPNIANLLWSAQGKSKIAPWLVAQLGFNPNLARTEDVEAYIKLVAKLDMIVLLQLLKDYENYDATSWLHEIKVPTLVISGENDFIIPYEAQEVMHQLIPYSKFELIRNGSHCPQMDIPDLVNLIIERFLNEASQTNTNKKTEYSYPNSQDQNTQLSSCISSAQTSRQREIS